MAETSYIIQNGRRLDLKDAAARKSINELNEKIGMGGSGATFTPSVDADGNLSWTNDKGLENPEPMNITGPQGPQGCPR